MIKGINENHAIQLCNCGAENEVGYETIRYDGTKKLTQFILPSCPKCKARIEFIFISNNMTALENKLFYEMFSRGYVK